MYFGHDFYIITLDSCTISMTDKKKFKTEESESAKIKISNGDKFIYLFLTYNGLSYKI